MRLLLDTQVMLWWLLDDPRLRPETRELMAANPCVVSVASLWEVAIKHRLGKLGVAPAVFRDQSLAAGALLLPVPVDPLMGCSSRQTDRSTPACPPHTTSGVAAQASPDGLCVERLRLGVGRAFAFNIQGWNLTEASNTAPGTSALCREFAWPLLRKARDCFRQTCRQVVLDDAPDQLIVDGELPFDRRANQQARAVLVEVDTSDCLLDGVSGLPA
jgi:PIN domain nuclease of toxin-antitoxin system